MNISIIIPTHNRPGQLIRLLESLEKCVDELPDFEVFAVNDGSSAPYDNVQIEGWSFCFSIIYQENQGEAVARNAAANVANGELLLFLDDDMEVTPGYVNAMYSAHCDFPEQILIGNMITPVPPVPTIYQNIMIPELNPVVFGEVTFTNILAGVLGISKTLYNKLGQMQPVPDIKRGRWSDLDFAYRAYLEGVKFIRVRDAVVYHHDYTMMDFLTTCQRFTEVSRLAPALFSRLPGLKEHIPMFTDKHPISWTEDKTGIIIRKLLRRVASAQFLGRAMESTARFVEKYIPSPGILRPLYRWILGGYIYRGYRQGLREIEINTNDSQPT